MKKGLTEMVFILDRSGSMGGLESDTIGGFNAMLAKQREVEGEAVVTTVLFDDRYELLHDRIALPGVQPMTREQYYVRGCTALLDAIGRTIWKIASVQEHTAESQRAEKVVFVITTDGLENASREYDYAKIRRLIEEKQKQCGWEFVFLGANMDAVSEGARMGIRADRAATYQCDGDGVQKNYEAVSEFLESARTCAAPVGSSWKRNIKKPRGQRGRTNKGMMVPDKEGVMVSDKD